MPKNFRQEQIKGVIQNSNSFAILTQRTAGWRCYI